MRSTQRTEAPKIIPRKQAKHQTCEEGVPEWLKEALECPVCWETIREPPIFMCASTLAHSLCTKCHRQVSECPICREQLTDRRSHALEKLIEKLPQAHCHNGGCSFKNSDASVVKRHEDRECEHRTIACFCEEQIRVSDFVSHCVTAHGHKKSEPMKLSYFRKIRTLVSPLKRGQGAKLGIAIPYEVKRNGGENAVFLMNWTTDGNCLIFWMSFLGPRREAEKFKYSIKIKNFHKVTVTEYVYEGARACVPCDISHKEMKVQRCGILIDRKLIIRAADYEDILHYCIQIDATGDA